MALAPAPGGHGRHPSRRHGPGQGTGLWVKENRRAWLAPEEGVAAWLLAAVAPQHCGDRGERFACSRERPSQ